jgi:probable phosphoglycerate mutase
LIREPQAFDFVASPMIRTRHTMELVRQAMGLEEKGYRTDPRLMEMNFGDWQGYTIAELEARHPGSTRGRVLDKWDFRPPGEKAESYQMLLERVRPFFEELYRPTVCVTHGGVIRALFRVVEKVSKAKAGSVETPQDRVLRWQDGHLQWL